MKGIDLKLRRVGLRVKASDLARAMSVSTSRVSHIEARDQVPEDATRKYLEALATFATVSSDGEAA